VSWCAVLKRREEEKTLCQCVPGSGEEPGYRHDIGLLFDLCLFKKLFLREALEAHVSHSGYLS